MKPQLHLPTVLVECKNAIDVGRKRPFARRLEIAMKNLNTLLDCDPPAVMPSLPRDLRQLYDGDLTFPSRSTSRPYVLANFVSTLDGVVSFKSPGHADGSTISGSDSGDHFIMGLLRASADAIVVGSGTVRDVGPNALWTPGSIYPDADDLFTKYRTEVIGKLRFPLLVVITRSGQLDLNRAAFQHPEIPALILTTRAGEATLAASGAEFLRSVEIRSLGDGSTSIAPAAILNLLASKFHVERVLHEGGPSLFGEFLAAGLIDELFLTLSPQIAGRSHQSDRPGIVEGLEFSPTTAPWLRLVSIRQREQHLYLRYRRQ